MCDCEQMVDIVRAVLQCMPKICPNNSTANLSLNVVAKLPTRLLSCTFRASRYAADSLRCFYPVLLLSTSLAFLCSILPALCYVVLRTLVALHCFFRSVGCLLDQPASQHCSDFLTSWQGKLLTQTEPSHLVPPNQHCWKKHFEHQNTIYMALQSHNNHTDLAWSSLHITSLSHQFLLCTPKNFICQGRLPQFRCLLLAVLKPIGRPDFSPLCRFGCD